MRCIVYFYCFLPAGLIAFKSKNRCHISVLDVMVDVRNANELAAAAILDTNNAKMASPLLLDLHGLTKEEAVNAVRVRLETGAFYYFSMCNLLQ